ncbi:MAG: hypothetical protein WCV58_01025 [Patescibacteria group bacterium]
MGPEQGPSEVLSQEDWRAASLKQEKLESDFENKKRISAEVFELAGYNIGDPVFVKKNGEVVSGEIDHFTTITTMGREEPAAVVSGDRYVDTVRLYELNLANPTEDFEKSMEEREN